MSGAYEVTARAFAGIECPPAGEECECTPGAEGSCVTEVSLGQGELSTSAVFAATGSTVELVFREN